MRRAGAMALVAGLFLAFASLPALAHGEQETTTPRDGSRVDALPEKIEIGLTEPAGPGSTLKAFDGCNDRVAGPVERSGQKITLVPAGGEPGRWHVEWRAISSVDGHPTKGHWVFRFAGTKDCSKAAEETPGDGDQIGGGEDTRVSAPPSDEEGGFPVVPFAVGTVVVVGAAVVLRRASTSR